MPTTAFTAHEHAAPGIIEVYGQDDVGKTTFAMEIARHFRQVVYFDLDRKGIPAEFQNAAMIVAQPTTAEEACGMLRDLVLLHDTSIVLDTLAALSLSADLQAGYGDNPEPYRLSRYFVAELRHLLLPLYQRRNQLLLVNQLRELDQTQSYRPLGRHYPLFCARRIWLHGFVRRTAPRIYRGQIDAHIGLQPFPRPSSELS